MCQGIDGSRIVSNEVSFLVRSPVNAEEDELGELFLGDEQGKLLYLLGSDSEFLADGNAAFDLVLEKYPRHPMAVYAGLVKGFNAARTFKTVTAEKKLQVRDARPRAWPARRGPHRLRGHEKRTRPTRQPPEPDRVHRSSGK